MWSPLALFPPTPGSAVAPMPAQFVSVDPWSPNPYVDLKGDRTFLSFPNAVKAVAEKVASVPVPAALAVALTAASYAEFAAVLNAFSTAFPLPLFQRLARRALAMDALETSKFVLAQPQAAVSGFDLSGLPKLRALRRADLLTAASAAADAFALSDPLANLTDLIADKAEHSATVAAAQSEAATGLSGPVLNGWRFYADADPLATLSIGHPDHDFTLTALILFFGTPLQLAVPAAIFGAEIP